MDMLLNKQKLKPRLQPLMTVKKRKKPRCSRVTEYKEPTLWIGWKMDGSTVLYTKNNHQLSETVSFPLLRILESGPVAHWVISLQIGTVSLVLVNA